MKNGWHLNHQENNKARIKENQNPKEIMKKKCQTKPISSTL